MFGLTLLLLVSFAVSFFCMYLLLPVLRFFKVGQKVRQEGPAGHAGKSGTPTMGGIGIILTLLVCSFIFLDLDLNPSIFALLLVTIGFGVIGFLDDLIKFKNHSNQGFFGWQKFWLQVAVAFSFSLFILSASNQFFASPDYIKTLFLGLPVLYLLFLAFMIVGSANATNLNDGLDGLLAGCSTISLLAFSLICLKQDQMGLASFAVIGAGAMLGFLWYNRYPAKVFMGDAGSLAIGAFLSGIAILSHREFLLLLIGFPFVIETLSVILQVASFKIFKKRIFKMAPLHHHFELCGMKETKIVYMFWVVTFVCGAIAVIMA
ncbi:MAG: phospho-N-acetylmuramoyl-pentapeptide-transferase [Candidatus Saganbacteria bacterium]|nr:phospho-N-acetylmuramoyl-pentapeptide-transferase [Candidatus Saganbacteria bacterium]